MNEDKQNTWDSKEGQTHFENDACGEVQHNKPEHAESCNASAWEKEFDRQFRFKYDICERDAHVEVNGVWLFIKKFIASIESAAAKRGYEAGEKTGKANMRLSLGCTCKNLAPASVHFKDCPLGQAYDIGKKTAEFGLYRAGWKDGETVARGEERKRITEIVKGLPITCYSFGIERIDLGEVLRAIAKEPKEHE